jgi:hypothetical protein
MRSSAADKASKLRLDQSLEVRRPAPEIACLLPVGELERQLERIENANDGNFFQSFGWFLLGVSVTACFTALQAGVSADPGQLPTYCWSAFVTSLLGGIVSLVFARIHRLDRATLRRAALEDIRFLIQRYKDG